MWLRDDPGQRHYPVIEILVFLAGPRIYLRQPIKPIGGWALPMRHRHIHAIDVYHSPALDVAIGPRFLMAFLGFADPIMNVRKIEASFNLDCNNIP